MDEALRGREIVGCQARRAEIEARTANRSGASFYSRFICPDCAASQWTFHIQAGWDLAFSNIDIPCLGRPGPVPNPQKGKGRWTVIANSSPEKVPSPQVDSAEHASSKLPRNTRMLI